MKIYIMCDLEGAAGVIDHRKQCWFDGEYYQQARRLATLELNALVEGALEGGAREIIAWDGHGPFPGGLDVSILHPACKMVMGAGDGGPQGLDDSFDAAFQCGLHAMAGATHAVLAHSFLGHVAGIWVNEIPWGEIAMNAYTAGELDVPCVFISGDKAAAEEARALIPDIHTAIVKEGLSPVAVDLLKQAPVVSLAPEKACQLIREAACEAMRHIGEIKPFYLEPPYTIRTKFYEEKHAKRAAGQPGVQRIDALTIELRDREQIELVF
jgi:D-amino peptidase